MTTVLLLGDDRIVHLREALQLELQFDDFVLDISTQPGGTYNHLTWHAFRDLHRRYYDQIYIFGGIWDCLRNRNGVWDVRYRSRGRLVELLLEQQRLMLGRLDHLSPCIIITDVIGIDLHRLNNGIGNFDQSQIVLDRAILSANRYGRLRYVNSEFCSPPFVRCLYRRHAGRTHIIYNRGFDINMNMTENLTRHVLLGMVEAAMLNRQVINERIREEDEQHDRLNGSIVIVCDHIREE